MNDQDLLDIEMEWRWVNERKGFQLLTNGKLQNLFLVDAKRTELHPLTLASVQAGTTSFMRSPFSFDSLKGVMSHIAQFISVDQHKQIHIDMNLHITETIHTHQETKGNEQCNSHS